jgi:hypothetical protein
MTIQEKLDAAQSAGNVAGEQLRQAGEAVMDPSRGLWHNPLRPQYDQLFKDAFEEIESDSCNFQRTRHDSELLWQIMETQRKELLAWCEKKTGCSQKAIEDDFSQKFQEAGMDETQVKTLLMEPAEYMNFITWGMRETEGGA